MKSLWFLIPKGVGAQEFCEKVGAALRKDVRIRTNTAAQVELGIPKWMEDTDMPLLRRAGLEPVGGL